MDTVLPDPVLFALIRLNSSPTKIIAVICPKQSTSLCPKCRQPATRIHSTYQRRLADLPWHGVALHLDLHARKWFCDTLGCPRRIFTERFPNVVRPYARRTIRLDMWFTAVGLALGGEAGARLLRDLGLVTSPDAVLHHIRTLAVPLSTDLQVIGGDEFAFRRGRVFGTVIVDLLTHQVVDLLSSRDTAVVAQWLHERPTIRMVSRDRAQNYGEAIRQGAPDAQQIADRFHILQNLTERVEIVLRAHKEALKTKRGDLLESLPTLLNQTPALHERSQDVWEQRRQLYEQVQALKARGINPPSIAKVLGKSRSTVYLYAQMTSPPDRLRMTNGALRPVPAYLPFILQRWNDGCRNATQIWRELQALGKHYSLRTITRQVTILRREQGVGQSFAPVSPQEQYHPQAPPPPALTAHQAARVFMKEPTKLSAQEQSQLALIWEHDAQLATVYALAQRFCRMIRTHDNTDLETWLNEMSHSAQATLVSFAASLHKDLDAVSAGISSLFSQGPVEGHVNRIKLIKRSSYGKMGFATLRQRTLIRQTS
jgi:transposase